MVAKKVLFIIVFSLMVVTPLGAEPQHGPFVHFSFFPTGMSGGGSLPYNENPEDDPAGTVDIQPQSGNEFGSVSKWKIGGGYFYDIFMIDLAYSNTTVADHVINDGGVETEESQIDAEISHFTANAGIRLSNPGDSSYSFFYIGYKQMDYSTDYLNIELNGKGFTAGYTGFYTFCPQWDFEPALLINAYAGNYRDTDFKCDAVTGSSEKIKSITAGGTVGAGVQYEPYNITLLAVASIDYDQITHLSEISDGSAEFGVSQTGYYFGFALMYQYINYKYNR